MVHHERKELIRRELKGQLRFLTFSCFQSFDLFNEDNRFQIFVNSLEQTRSAMHFRLIGWVVMPNHVHLMIRPELPEYPVSKVLHSLKRRVSLRILPELRKANNDRQTHNRDIKFWQAGGGYDRNIISREEYIEKMNYIHRNPVKAGLVERAIDWKWSSARWYENMPSVIEIDQMMI